MSDVAKIIVLKPICLFEISRYRSTVSALFKELVKNNFFVIPENTWVAKPSIKQVRKMNLLPEEVGEFCSGSLVCVEVADTDNKISKIVEDLNLRFSSEGETWFKIFGRPNFEDIKNWTRLN
jgi:hypothetical protein